MAAENIKSVTPLFREVIGSRYLAVVEVKLPKKYKTEGCEISAAQLVEAGLPAGIVDVGWIVAGGNAAKNAAGILAQLNITNPGGPLNKPATAQKVKVQLYETETGAHPLKEQASEAVINEEGTLVVALIGR